MSILVEYLSSGVYVLSPEATGTGGIGLDTNFKALVDTDVSHAATLASHVAATTAHGATSTATANTIPLRDINGGTELTSVSGISDINPNNDLNINLGDIGSLFNIYDGLGLSILLINTESGEKSISTPYNLILTDDATVEANVFIGSLSGNATTATTAGTISGSITESQVVSLVSDLSAKASTASVTSAIATHAALTATHGVAGSIVGTSDSQTLTNKTISGASNTLSAIAQSSVTNLVTDLAALASTASVTSAIATHAALTNTHGVGGSIVGTIGIQTLTNKTISGSSNTLTNIAQSSITSLVSDLALKAPLASPTFTGTVTAGNTVDVRQTLTSGFTSNSAFQFTDVSTGRKFFNVVPRRGAGSASDDFLDIYLTENSAYTRIFASGTFSGGRLDFYADAIFFQSGSNYFGGILLSRTGDATGVGGGVPSGPLTFQASPWSVGFGQGNIYNTMVLDLNPDNTADDKNYLRWTMRESGLDVPTETLMTLYQNGYLGINYVPTNTTKFAALHVQIGASTTQVPNSTKTALLKRRASQTGDMLDVQNESGVTLARIDKDGKLVATDLTTAGRVTATTLNGTAGTLALDSHLTLSDTYTIDGSGGAITDFNTIACNSNFNCGGNAGITVFRSWTSQTGVVHSVQVTGGIITAWDEVAQ
jgi:hypothetical protein